MIDWRLNMLLEQQTLLTFSILVLMPQLCLTLSESCSLLTSAVLSPATPALQAFELIDTKEMVPLQELIDQMLR